MNAKTFLGAAVALVILSSPLPALAAEDMCSRYPHGTVCTPYESWGSEASCDASEWPWLAQQWWCVDDTGDSAVPQNADGSCWGSRELMTCAYGNVVQTRRGPQLLECYMYLDDQGGETCGGSDPLIEGGGLVPCNGVDANGVSYIGYETVDGQCLGVAPPPCAGGGGDADPGDCPEGD